MNLRDYQRASIDALYGYFECESGNPVIALPTGSGKSVVLAHFIKEACDFYPQTRIVVLTHVRELLEQDMAALLRAWPEAPASYYSAGLGQKKVSQITFAGIQSAYALPTLFSPADLVIVDEAHLVPKKTEGTYRTFLAGLQQHNPAVKIIGLTATPYRLDSGLLTEGSDRIFTDIAYEANVGTLVMQGYLCPLVSRAGAAKADLSGVRTRGGEFVPADAEKAYMEGGVLDAALDEVLALAGERKSWLLFCSGVEHADRAAKALKARGISAACVTGETSSNERRAILNGFKNGAYRAVTNCDVLTTGFDHPGIDLIAMMRPTKSTGLYVQMIGRGLRKAATKTETLVLDYAGNVERHGPIDQIKIRPKREKGEGAVTVAPVKECPTCHSFVFPAVMTCPTCGHIWESKPAHGDTASDAPVLAAGLVETLPVHRVIYRIHEKPGSPMSMRVDYYSDIRRFSEFVCLEHEGYAAKRAVAWFWRRGMPPPASVFDAVTEGVAGRIPAPSRITVRPDGKYWRIVTEHFDQKKEAA